MPPAGLPFGSDASTAQMVSLLQEMQSYRASRVTIYGTRLPYRSCLHMLQNTRLIFLSRQGGISLLLTALLVSVLALLLAGCGGEPSPTALPSASTATPTVAPTPTPEPLILLPQDEAPHGTPVEWWYFNGMLRDDAGGEYSYHFVTFQSPGPQGVVPHLLQATLSDHGRGVHYTGEQPLLAPERPEAQGVDVATGGWVMRGDGSGYEMRMVFGGGATAITLELSAIPERDPVLHGGTGLVHMGADAGSTYYYSRTRLGVSGWIEENGEGRQVRGPGWMDHQWGEIASGRVGWDWAGVQLDDGADLMAAVVWHPEGRRLLAAHGTYIAPDGTVSYFEGNDLAIAGQGSWTSADTGVEYPSGLRLEIRPIDLELELTPYLEQAEFSSEVLGVAYWEGAASVSGQRGGETVSGWAFVELVGYDPRQAEVTPPVPAQRP